MSFEYFIAKRYLGAKKRTGFVSIITYVSIAGIVIGVTALILVLSVMNGFEDEVRSRLISADAHLRVRKYFTETITKPDSIMQIIRQNKHVVGVTPSIYEEGMIRSESTQRPTAIKAVDVKTADEVTGISQKMVLGDLDFSEREINGKKLPGIVLGRYLADELIASKVGDIVSVWAMPSEGGFFAQPRIKQFYVAGLVEFGFYDYDKITSYVSIKDAQSLFDMQGVSWIEIKVDNYENADEIGDEITHKMGYPFTSLSWHDMHKSLFSWMAYEKIVAFIVLSLIIMVAAFNIISSLVMVVMDKTREIGIMKSMGATSKTIMRIFLFEGLLVGAIGTFLGCLIGYTIAFLQIKFGIVSLPPDVYLISSLPVKVSLIHFVSIAGISMFLSLIASVYPAYKASRLEPVEAIRYE